MKIKKIQISIPKPCFENWNEMTPTLRGKFCSSCQKEVIDFTEKSDLEISNLISRNKNSCGRFIKSQLQRDIDLIEYDKQHKLKYAAVLALGLLVGKNGMAQNEIKPNSILSIKQDILKDENINEIKQDSFELTIKVISENGNKITNAKVLLSSFTKGWTKALTTNGNGDAILRVTKEEFPFLVLSNATKYFIANDTIEEPTSSFSIMNLKIPEDESGFTQGIMSITDESDELKNIYFDFHKSNIRKESEKELKKLVKFLKENKTTIVELNAYTDSRGTKAFNIQLSKEMALNTKKWLIKNGISTTRINMNYFGETKFKNECIDGVECSEYEQQRNRRIEFRIIDKKNNNIDMLSLERFDMQIDSK